MKNGPEREQFESAAGQPTGSEAAGTPGADAALEAALRQALRPETPPTGFGDRLMARAIAGDRPTPLAPPIRARDGKLLHWPQSRLWITFAVAAALIAGVFEGGVAVRHVREQQRRIVEATKQFQTTERITVHALSQAREQLQRAGVPLNLD